jgi:hypothetical protein
VKDDRAPGEVIGEAGAAKKRTTRQTRALARIANRAAKTAPARRASAWRELEAHLLKGATSDGAKLSPAECQTLGEIMRGIRKRPRGRPRDLVAEVRAKHIAALTILFEFEGHSVKAIVEKAAEIYGVGRSVVWEARRQWGPFFSDRLGRASPKVRELIFQHIMRNTIDYWILRQAKEESD